jgi:hypothetical protein
MRERLLVTEARFSGVVACSLTNQPLQLGQYLLAALLFNNFIFAATKALVICGNRTRQ